MESANNMEFDFSLKRIWVAGHRGMVGSALVRRLATENCRVLTADRKDVDLRNQAAVERWISNNRPQVIFLAAAKVGGILANASFPAEFLYDNLMIEANIIHSAWKCGVSKLVFLGSTCIYPKEAPQPIPEEALLTGPLEPTNEWYAIAKIAGIKLCQAYRKQYGCDFIAVQPTNLYGPGDNYDLSTSHVLAALIRKAHEAKETNSPSLIVWGTGRPMREFLHVDDLADATVFLAKNYSDSSHINIGSGEEVTIRELAELVCRVVGYRGNLEFDSSKPDGTMRKLCNVMKLNAMGWNRARQLEDGVRETFELWIARDDQNS